MNERSNSFGLDSGSFRDVDVAATEFLLSLVDAPRTQVSALGHLVGGGFASFEPDNGAGGALSPVQCDVDAVFALYRHESARGLPRGALANVSVRDMAVRRHMDLVQERSAEGALGGEFDEGEVYRPQEFRQSPAKYVKSVLDSGVSMGHRAKAIARKAALVVGTVLALGAAMPLAADVSHSFDEPVVAAVQDGAGSTQGVLEFHGQTGTEGMNGLNDVAVALSFFDGEVGSALLAEYEVNRSAGTLADWGKHDRNMFLSDSGGEEFYRGKVAGIDAYQDEYEVRAAKHNVVHALDGLPGDVQDRVIGAYRDGLHAAVVTQSPEYSDVNLRAENQLGEALALVPGVVQDEILTDYVGFRVEGGRGSVRMSIYNVNEPGVKVFVNDEPQVIKNDLVMFFDNDVIRDARQGVAHALDGLSHEVQDGVIEHYQSNRVEYETDQNFSKELVLDVIDDVVDSLSGLPVDLQDFVLQSYERGDFWPEHDEMVSDFDKGQVAHASNVVVKALWKLPVLAQDMVVANYRADMKSGLVHNLQKDVSVKQPRADVVMGL